MRVNYIALLVVVAAAVLLAFASWFDFQCDDAFIAFRYAQNWAKHGQIAYNIGERVEGYTSFVWVLLLAALHVASIPVPLAAQLLGAASGILLLVFTARLALRLIPKQPLSVAALLALLAGNACVAAWTLGGLETPLYTALLVAALLATATWLERETSRSACFAALVFALATLTRPEAALLFGSVACVLLFSTLRERRLPPGLPQFFASYLAIITTYLFWRKSYYGDLLPNTFHVKTTGTAAALRAQGFDYLGFCAEELGWWFIAGLLGLALLAALHAPSRSAAQRLIVPSSLLFTVAMLGHVASIGGDFLDLYRFLVPTFPLLFASAIAGLDVLWQRVPQRPARPWLGMALALLFFAWYLPHQLALARRAMQQAEPGRRQHGIEPLGWTANYALRWAATGRWLAAHAQPGDWLAVGAAGAMPFFSGLPNIDTFGLCDRTVARQGRIIGSRPGHQRFATTDYLIERAPTFLLIEDYATDHPTPMTHSAFWEQHGYVRIEAEVRTLEHGAPRPFFHYMLAKGERAAQLQKQPLVRVAEP